MTIEEYSSKELLNVFVDAGVHSIESGKYKNTMSASGVMVYQGNKLIHSNVTILKQSTNNIGELLALFIGVNTAINIKRSLNEQRQYIRQINIYSDSAYSVNCVTKWYPKWIENGRDKKTGLLSNTCGRVKNQELIEAIIRSITLNHELINFVRVRGHQDSNNYESVQKTQQYIEQANIVDNGFKHYTCRPNEEVTKQIIQGNNAVDMLAGSMYPNTIQEYFSLPAIRDLFPMTLYNITPEEYEDFEWLTQSHFIVSFI